MYINFKSTFHYFYFNLYTTHLSFRQCMYNKDIGYDTEKAVCMHWQRFAGFCFQQQQHLVLNGILFQKVPWLLEGGFSIDAGGGAATGKERLNSPEDCAMPLGFHNTNISFL